MPRGFDFWCDNCDFVRRDVQEVAYSIDQHSKRLYASDDQVVDSPAGMAFETVCVDCSHLFFRDPKKDPLSCPSCGSASIFEIQQLQHRPCPFCRDGTILSNQPDLFQ